VLLFPIFEIFYTLDVSMFMSTIVICGGLA